MQAIEIWKKVDPAMRYVVDQWQLEEHAAEAEWLPSDYFDGIDANGDGVVSAQEACLKTGVWKFECKDLPNFEWHEPNWDEKKLDFLVGWYRVDRDQDEQASLIDIRAARSAEYTDEQVSLEFYFYTGGEDVATFPVVFEQWKSVQVRLIKFWHWFESLKTNEDEYLDSNELANDASGMINLSDNTSGSVEYSKYDLCLMWFTDVPMICEEDMQYPEDDIAPEAFIQAWYAFDRDQDEVAHLEDYLDWASNNQSYSWMSREDVKEHIWDPIDIDGSGSMTFEEALNNYYEVASNFSKLEHMASLLGANETERKFDITQLENQMVTFKEEFETNNDNWDPQDAFQSWDTNSDGYVSIDKELCAAYVGWQYCGPPEDYEGGSSGDSGNYYYDWNYEEARRDFWVQWYRVDKNQDEQVDETELRAARDDTINDAQVSAEFAHYDLDGDGIVTIDEAHQVWQQDEEDFDSWFEELALQDGDGWYLDEWELNTDPKIDFYAADTDQDSRVTKDEACAQFFNTFPQKCSGFNDVGEDIADEHGVWLWYGMDTDKDESVTFSDFVVWWQYIEYGKYSWMTSEEIDAAFFTAWDSNSDGLLSFAEAKAGRWADDASLYPLRTLWGALSPGWDESVNKDTLVDAWQDSWVTELGIEQDNPYTFFDWLDIDSDGGISYGEACAAMSGKRWRCFHWLDQSKLDWRYDINLDRFVERAEYERVLSAERYGYAPWKDWLHGKYWDQWLAVDASDPSKLTFAHIQARVAMKTDVEQTWQDALTAINIEPKGSTTIGSDQALELFNMVIDDETDRNGDGRIQYSEFCMSQLHEEVACLTEIERDIQYYDTNDNGGVGWDEFLVIMESEDSMESVSEDYLNLFFNLYDTDNDGLINVRNIWDMEEMWNHTMAFNSTGWHWAAFELLDGNNDTFIEHGEFNTGMNVILTLIDLQLMDSQQSDTVYNQVFDSVSTDSELNVTYHQQYALWAFMKDVLKRGLDSYMQDNNITQ